MKKISNEFLEVWLEELENEPITFSKHLRERGEWEDYDASVYGHFGTGDPPFYEGLVAEVFELNYHPKMWIEAVSNIIPIIKELLELRKYKEENEMAKELEFK